MSSKLLVVVVAISAIASQDLALGQQGGLTVTPESGPVGATVTLGGEGCGQQPLILFGGTGLEGQGTAGSSAVSEIVTNEQGKFQVLYTIPAEIGPQQQWQGGPVVSGRYNFTSKPPACQTFFTVTLALPSSGGPDSSWAGKGWALAITGALTFAVGITGVGVLLRTSKRLRQ